MRLKILSSPLTPTQGSDVRKPFRALLGLSPVSLVHQLIANSWGWTVTCILLPPPPDTRPTPWGSTLPIYRWLGAALTIGQGLLMGTGRGLGLPRPSLHPSHQLPSCKAHLPAWVGSSSPRLSHYVACSPPRAALCPQPNGL